MPSFAELTPYKVTENQVIYFRLEARKNEDKTKEKGTPVYDDVETLEVRLLNDPTLVVVKDVDDEVKTRYSGQYALFQKALSASESGFPLKEWAGCTRGEAETLANTGVKTVEQLNATEDRRLTALGFQYLDLKKKAALFLSQGQGSAEAQKWLDRIADLEGDNASKDEEIKTLRARLAEHDTHKKHK